MEITFKDGVRVIQPLMDNHLYSRVNTSKKFKEFYEASGQIGESDYLGNFYVEAPYGKSFHIPARRVDDIISVTFVNNGYGYMVAGDLESGVGNVNTPMIREINLLNYNEE